MIAVSPSFLAHLDAAAVAARAWLDRRSLPAFIAIAVPLPLGVSPTMLPPRLIVFVGTPIIAQSLTPG